MHNLSVKLDRLEAELSPSPKTKITVTFAKTDEEVAELRKNAIAQGEMYILTWLPPQE
jgi:hypothetical protein